MPLTLVWSNGNAVESISTIVLKKFVLQKLVLRKLVLRK